jgi:hypothetical protein
LHSFNVDPASKSPSGGELLEYIYEGCGFEPQALSNIDRDES